jgi:hypothetical protein
MSSMVLYRKENGTWPREIGYDNAETRPDTDPLNQLELKLHPLEMEEV